MKYIIVEEEGIPSAILFSELITHRTVAVAYSNVISAGFCSLYRSSDSYDIEANCYGESTSLKIQSREKIDEDIIKRSIEFKI